MRGPRGYTISHTDTSNPSFNSTLKRINDILLKEDIPYHGFSYIRRISNLYKTQLPKIKITKDQDEYVDDKGHVLTYIYHLNNLDIDYHFEYEHLNKKT